MSTINNVVELQQVQGGKSSDPCASVVPYIIIFFISPALSLGAAAYHGCI